MYQYSNSLIRQFSSVVTGNAAVGIQAAVYVGETGALASLFEVNGSPKLNPVTTDDKGFYSFSVADGDYRIVFSSSQFATLRISVLDGAQIREEFDGLVASNLAFRNEQQAAYDSFVLSQGWDQVGTFAAGFTFTSPNQVGQDADGNWWRWNGAFPKTVAPATDPTSDSDYKLVGDGVLRSDLANGDADVGGVSSGDLARKYEDCVFVEDYGATGNPLVDDSVSIQSAINTGKGVRGVNGKSYKASGLTSSTNGQFFAHLKLVKSSDNEIFESSARDLHFHYCSFDGDGLSSDNVHLTGDNPTFDHCSSSNTLGRPLVSEGFGTRIIGTNDVYLTLESSGAVPAIELGNSVAQTLYSQIIGITTSTSGGGVKLVKHGSCSISNSQISGIDVPFGSGAYIDTCRITGDLNIQGNFTKVDDCTVTGDVVIGDGVNPISAVKFGDGNSVQSGSTVTVNTKIIESVIHLDQLDDGVIIDDNLTGDLSDIDNSVYTKAVSFTPTWTGATTNPVLGNANLSAKYTRQGRTTKIDFSLTMGSTTTYGAGDWRFSLPVYAATNATGPVKILDAGNIFRTGVVEVDAVNSRMRCFTDGAGGAIRDSVPFTWATDDKLDFSVIYESR